MKLVYASLSGLACEQKSGIERKRQSQASIIRGLVHVVTSRHISFPSAEVESNELRWPGLFFHISSDDASVKMAQRKAKYEVPQCDDCHQHAQTPV